MQNCMKLRVRESAGRKEFFPEKGSGMGQINPVGLQKSNYGHESERGETGSKKADPVPGREG